MAIAPKRKSTKQIIKDKLTLILNNKTNKFTDTQISLILTTLDTNATVTKIIDETVYCSYFKDYLPKEKFNMIKRNDKLVYNAMSIEGGKLRQKELNAKNTRDKALATLILDDDIKDIKKTKETILKTYETAIANLHQKV